MKSTAALGTATRTVGKLLFALILLVAAVAVGFGGTALYVYHQFGDTRRPAAQPARGDVAERRVQAQPARNGMDDNSPVRRVAALPSDQPQYTYADNSGGLPSAPVKRPRQMVDVPAPLDPPAQAVDVADTTARLNDPESRYIVDSRTGRVVGIDGSAGARIEEDQEWLRQLSEPPRAVAVQTPPPEVRIASPVIEDGQPVYHGTPASTVNAADSQYVPVRKALPVTIFNAAEYLMNDQDRPVLRAQPVLPAGTRVVKTVHIYRLPDGSQSVAVD